ncbi:hypothetical protein ACFCX4_07015 [Kitasatospora sp. NPDC056327]|uniref:hypothetical protein n=1 Tax=Kitasatospora sp. NPDC056327 TaxID=3345785 RepID=UPI0035D62117
MARSRITRPAALAAAAATVVLVAGTAPAAVAAPADRLPAAQLLPVPQGALHSLVSGLNSGGTVIGQYFLEGSDGPLAVRWKAGRPGYTRLAPLPGEQYSRTSALSDSGTVVGLSYNSLLASHPVRWAPDGTPTPLTLPAGSSGGNASSVNDDGVAVGDAFDAGNRYSPVRWRPDGTGTGLPALPGDDSGSAAAINDAGTAVGWSGRHGAGGTAHPVVWNAAGRVRALPLPAGITDGKATRITGNGVVLGQGRTAGNTEYDRVLVWAADGTVRDAGFGLARSVNRRGTAVGTSLEGTVYGNPARWAADGTQTVLANPAAPAGEALGVNNRGTAVGYGWPPGDNPALDKALLWKPDGTVVPLPPSPLGPYSAATYVNDSEVIAGVAVGTDAAGRASVWRAAVWKR